MGQEGDERVGLTVKSGKFGMGDISVRCRIWLNMGPISISSCKTLLWGFGVSVLQAGFDWWRRHCK